MAVDKVTHEKLQASQEREENSVIKRTSGVDLFLKDAVDVIMLVASLCALALIIESENLSLAWMGMCPLALTAQILILVAASGCKAPPMPACKSEMALHDLTDEHLFKVLSNSTSFSLPLSVCLELTLRDEHLLLSLSLSLPLYVRLELTRRNEHRFEVPLQAGRLPFHGQVYHCLRKRGPAGIHGRPGQRSLLLLDAHRGSAPHKHIFW